MGNGRSFWSDMFEMEKLTMIESNVTGKPLGFRKTIGIQQVYDIRVNINEEIETISNPYDLYDKCNKLVRFRAVHFSHFGCVAVKFCRGSSRRSVAARQWHQSWLE